MLFRQPEAISYVKLWIAVEPYDPIRPRNRQKTIPTSSGVQHALFQPKLLVRDYA